MSNTALNTTLQFGRTNNPKSQNASSFSVDPEIPFCSFASQQNKGTARLFWGWRRSD
jgi:hypothetical protein